MVSSSFEQWKDEDSSQERCNSNSERKRIMIGKLVRLLPDDYPQYKGKVGIVVDERMVDRFVVNFNGTDHPFTVHRLSMQEVK